MQLFELLCVHHVNLLLHLLHGELIVHFDLWLSLRTAFGGDEYHTSAGTATIYGRRGSVLEHLYALHVVGVDEHILAGWETVHHIQRLHTAIYGVDTADTYGRSRPRCTACLLNFHTRRMTDEGLLQGGGRHIHFLRLDRCDSPCHVTLAHRAITNDHHIVQYLSVLLERYRHAAASGNDGLALVAHIGNG